MEYEGGTTAFVLPISASFLFSPIVYKKKWWGPSHTYNLPFSGPCDMKSYPEPDLSRRQIFLCGTRGLKSFPVTNNGHGNGGIFDTNVPFWWRSSMNAKHDSLAYCAALRRAIQPRFYISDFFVNRVDRLVRRVLPVLSRFYPWQWNR